MSYCRVIPRDFFNESKLLKCYGQLALKVLDGMLPDGISISIEETGEPFQVELDGDGYLFVANYEIFVNRQPASFRSLYNSKSNFPFYCSTEDGEVEVFDDQGNFAPEFVQAFAEKV